MKAPIIFAKMGKFIKKVKKREEIFSLNLLRENLFSFSNGEPIRKSRGGKTKRTCCLAIPPYGDFRQNMTKNPLF